MTEQVAAVQFRGNPSDAEVAAIVAVLAAAAHAQSVTSHPPMSTLGGWGSPADQHRYGLGSAPTEFVNARYSR
ncbi:acyl-CoA carboxylase epsilon subunit [Rhodococcoides kyotonense]|uniref:Acyl-CoA carboxylase epsilon subunit n=1 Tax=Rhodococcoides kyotonense TaxID=398843 RepID=A0A239NDG6_9NOCA|nr:acyl-CoA carboxylase epsilon subunit [Rhodococcus kyotonensis]SNT52915.1 Acyl-CoA carboxylase epsilon subunit [Rhodococcus kyotonensis]